VLAVLAVGCGAWIGGPPRQVTGVVIAADGPTAADVDTITLRTSDGQTLEFTIGTLNLNNGGLPAAHLREHLVSGEPITVFYYGTEINRYTDAAE
jgi:hypothetical protein